MTIEDQGVYEDTVVDYSSSSDESDLENTEDLPYYEQTIKEIVDGEIYQCMICTVEMDPYCKMFSCDHCFRVFDFECIKQWAEKSIKRNLEKSSDPGDWKCPNCMHGYKKPPQRSTCWCGKIINPEPNLLYPNSCGQTCGAKKHGGCKEHGCLTSCHLGPHNPCPLPIEIYCNCKKTSHQELCSSATERARKLRSQETYSCDTVCGLLLPCGVHKCAKKCHSGLCGDCPEEVVSKTNKIRCYCGLESKNKIACNKITVVGKSQGNNDDSWIGAFECENIRKINFDCDNHDYEVDCEVVDLPNFKKIKCPLSPDILTSCPCGETPILANERTSCTDPIPTCENICGKPLSKNKPEYKCPFKCHNGPCMDIKQYIEIKNCACEYTKYCVPYALKGPPKCYIQCDMLMSCRKHRCKEICCSGKPSAAKRNKMKRTFLTNTPTVDEADIEPMHVCLKTCNQLLNCKIHRCTRRCHQGKCSPCMESDSNDLVCPCGKTVVLAPVRCGTELPKCFHNCRKVGTNYETCGHKINPHPCHEGDCPNCIVSVLKECKCHRKTPVRTLCYIDTVSCGQSCYKPLEACSHYCMKKCHPESETCTENCVQVCNALRSDCGHKCTLPCHGSTECVVASGEDYICQVMVSIECDCGRIKKNIKCCDNKGEESMIACDDECKHFQRLLNFKKALGLSSTTTSTDGIIDTDENTHLKITTDTKYEDLKLPYLEDTLLVYGKNKSWCRQIELFLNNFIENSDILTHHFKPMPAAQRSFIRTLSNAFQLYSESQDKEPKRSVFIKKKIENGNIISVKPSMSLSVAQDIYWKYKDHVKELKIKHYKENQSKTFLNLKLPEIATTPVAEDTQYNCFVLNGKCNVIEIQEIIDKFIAFTLIGDVTIEQPDTSINRLVMRPVKDMTKNMERDMKMIHPMIKSSLQSKFSDNVLIELGKVNDQLEFLNTDETDAAPADVIENPLPNSEEECVDLSEKGLPGAELDMQSGEDIEESL